MSSLEYRHDKIVRILLKILGIWPYQNTTWTRVQEIIMISIYISGLFVQFAVFITHECTINMLVDVLSFLFFVIFAFFMYGIYYFKKDFLKEMMDRIFFDWKSCENNVELAILDDYTCMAQMLTKVFLYPTCFTLLSIILYYAIPISRNIVLNRNDSRLPHLHIISEYFVDQYKYYTFIVLHTVVVTCLALITVSATGFMVLGFTLHICAMLKVANYRMEIVMDLNILRISSAEKEYIIYERLVCAVDVHRRTVQLCNFIISNLDTLMLFALIITVASLSINMFRCLKAVTAFKDLVEIIISFVLVIGYFIITFVICHVGQQITDLNADIFKTIYNLPWYTAPRNIRKLFPFLLQNNNKDLYLTIKGIFDCSHKCCKMFVTTSISYFTVLYSFQ